MDRDLMKLKEKWQKEDKEKWTIVYPILLIAIVILFEGLIVKCL